MKHNSPFCRIGLGKGGLFMEGRYPILLGGQAVGEAQVMRQGLYLCFQCRCHFSGETMYRLTVTGGESTESLGIPAPKGEWFCLNARIPAKRLQSGDLVIRAVPKREALQGRFVPLSPEEPFGYLRRLKTAYLAVRNGQVGVVIQEQESV